MTQPNRGELVKWLVSQEGGMIGMETRAAEFLLKYNKSDMAFDDDSSDEFINTVRSVLHKLNTKAREVKESQESSLTSGTSSSTIVQAKYLEEECVSLNDKIIAISRAELHRRFSQADPLNIDPNKLNSFTDIAKPMIKLMEESWNGLSLWMDISKDLEGEDPAHKVLGELMKIRQKVNSIEDKK